MEGGLDNYSRGDRVRLPSFCVRDGTANRARNSFLDVVEIYTASASRRGASFGARWAE